MGELIKIKVFEVLVRIAHGETDNDPDIRDAPDEPRFRRVAISARRHLNLGHSRCETADAMVAALAGEYRGACVDVCSDDPMKSLIIFYND